MVCADIDVNNYREFLDIVTEILTTDENDRVHVVNLYGMQNGKSVLRTWNRNPLIQYHEADGVDTIFVDQHVSPHVRIFIVLSNEVVGIESEHRPWIHYVNADILGMNQVLI